MKIWEILKEPKHHAVYQATNTVDSWEGVEVQVIVDDKGHATIHYVTLPRINSLTNVSVGKVIPL